MRTRDKIFTLSLEEAVYFQEANKRNRDHVEGLGIGVSVSKQSPGPGTTRQGQKSSPDINLILLLPVGNQG